MRNAASVADLVETPATPRFDLCTQPWLPVLLDGDVVLWSLEQLLAGAHRTQGFAVASALQRHALLRFCTALVMALHLFDPDHDWRRVVRAGAPLPADATSQLLERLRAHLWLQHPTTPFLQDPTLPARITNRVGRNDGPTDVTDPCSALLAHLPLNSSPAWWYKPGEAGELTNAELARGLVVRHYAALPGNEAGTEPDGRRFSPGGQMISGPNDSSEVFWHTGTLAGTLVAGLRADDLDRIGQGSRFFWEAPDDPQLHQDPLWRATVSAAATLLVDTDTGARLLRATRRGAAVDGVAAARLADPHVLRVDRTATQPAQRLADTAPVTIDPQSPRYGDCYRFYRQVGHVGQLRHHLLQRRQLAYPPPPGTPVQLLTVRGGGTATGVRINAVDAATIDPSPYLLPAQQAERFTELVSSLADRVELVCQQAHRSAHQVLTRTAPHRRPVERACQQAEQLLWERTEPLVAQLHQLCGDATPQPAAIPTTVFEQWVAHALDTFETAFQPYPAVRPSRRPGVPPTDVRSWLRTLLDDTASAPE